MLALLLTASAAVIVASSSSSKFEWRSRIVRLKLQGYLSDMTWSELYQGIRPGSKLFDLEVLAETSNVFASVRNPHRTNADIKAGGEIYRSRCASCHAAGSAPDLTGADFRRGDSDWALFKTVSNGVPDTAMVPIRMSFRETWQVVAFVQSQRADVGAGSVRSTYRRARASAVSYDRLLNAANEPENWFTYSGTFSGQRFSRLNRINRSNVQQMSLAWVYQIATEERTVETSPLVIDGVMYLTEPPNNVVALEADTGRVIWTYERKLPEGIPLCCGRVNRGLAVLGDLLFLGTLDAHLVALHADNGTVAWETKVAEYKEGYSITGAPLALKDKVITGIAGGDYATRGFIAAYDFRTGKEIWRFHTIPEPGQPGNETWSGDSWRSGGCATWLTGSFDPEQNIVLWGVGNPAPDYNGDVRQGDNLYSNSIVALDADSGRLKWHFQFTPHDEHDWDSVHIPVLVDEEFSGRPRKLLLWANRSAFYYLLDRQTGEYLGSRAFAEQTWADGIDAKGRPVTRPESRPTKTGVLVSPGRHGATNWWSPSFSPITRLIYVPVSNSQNVFFKTEATVVHGEMYMAGVAHGRPTWAAFRALDFATGDLRWEYRPSGRAPLNLGGLLSTAGDVVFGGIGPTFFVLDAESGALLREFTLGGGVAAAPITYETAGRQQVTIAAGRSIFTFALHDVQAAAP